MERNIRLYTAYQGCWNALFWMPVFFLFFSSVLAPAQVLRLEAIYYLAVVLLEVPSGYFSDKIGRRPTLIIATLCWVVASVLFSVTASFEAFTIAQILLAAGMAFNSGTDTSLLYDSLDALGRADEIGDYEARAQSVGLNAGAAAALIGGLVAGIDLRFAYMLSAMAAVGALTVALRFAEPPAGQSQALPPVAQMVFAVRRLSDPALRWVFVFAVAMTVFNHVPYEFFQPWLDLLMADTGAEFSMTPALAGVLTALSMFISARASGLAIRIRERFGVPCTLLGVIVLQSGVMLGLGLFLHPLVITLILMRGVPGAIAMPVQNAITHSRLPSGIRATFLSIQSLAGRMAFSGSLILASFAMPQEEILSHATMATILLGYTFAALTMTALLAAGIRAFRTPPTPPTPPDKSII